MSLFCQCKKKRKNKRLQVSMKTARAHFCKSALCSVTKGTVTAGFATAAAGYNNMHLQVGSVSHVSISHLENCAEHLPNSFNIQACKVRRKSCNESHTFVANLLFFFFNDFLFFLPFRGETNTWSRREDERCSQASKHTRLTFTFMAV